ncbi:beta-galactosidase [Pseudokineococcus lusitanus]|uniref:beta-galactosidase n=1 Tax=Pseudokineococcus lusitanus TaxID=763993 RepID=A0A3N1GW99_9ACTN|nr:beta-galactosidase [Pseudokineococcus lusitanus]ROP34543.1 beta-galactosidase [Pseudokineococcus lusitanus]
MTAQELPGAGPHDRRRTVLDRQAVPPPERPAEVLPLPDRVLFGAAYYPEYTPQPRVKTDLDLMVEAGFTVVRVGESVWSTWEPEDGVLDLDWLEEALDGAHERGLSVVLGTPTYAVPMWLARKHPEIAAVDETGHRRPWGSRQEVDYTHPAFRHHAERIIRAVVGRYAEHPAVVGFQVDNEPGLHLFHNRSVVEGFVDELRRTYGTVDALNEAWGLTYWSHRLSTWADLWEPRGNAQPQYDLAWRAYQARLTTDFIAWQAGIVREMARPEQWVTTCVSYSRPAVDEWEVDRALDVAAGNPYYAMQDALAVPTPADPVPQGWTTTGTWSVVHSADRMYASKQAPFLVTETNAGPIGGSSTNFPAWDGQWRQVAWLLVARGARMVEYWHWHTLHAGTETYWGGVLPHDQRPGRVFEQLARLGAELGTAGDVVAGMRPDAQVGLLFSVPSKWGLAFQPHEGPRGPGHSPPDEAAYERLTGTWAQAAFDAGLGVRVVHDRWLVPPDGPARDPREVAAELPVLVVPALYVAEDALLDWLAAYAEAGGSLVLGPRTGYADPLARARLEVKPARLAAAAGVSYQEFTNLSAPVPLRWVGGTEPASWPVAGCATTWADALVADGAEVLARYEHPQLGRWPAVVSREHGRGRVTTVGTVPDAATGAALLDRVAVAAGVAPRDERRWHGSPSVTVTAATARDGRRVHVVHNWSWEPGRAVVPAAVTDLLGGDALAAGEALELGAWDVRVLVGP